MVEIKDKYLNSMMSGKRNQKRRKSVYLSGGFSRSFHADNVKCDVLHQTQTSPFVAVILYKTSGRFLGMGGIINRQTIITAKDVVKFSSMNPNNILIVAGYRSADWGPNAQVRNAHDIFFNEYELSLLKIENGWVFNERVRPIRVSQILRPFSESFYDNFLLFGVPTTSDFNPGDPVGKNSLYVTSKHTSDGENNCGSDYKSLKPEFNKDYHQCLLENNSLCSGCVGSPVIGVPKESSKAELVGIVIKSSCGKKPRKILILKLPEFSIWINRH